jgi:ABC-type sugar transport system ATPase subunit
MAEPERLPSPLLEATGIAKAFPGVQALRGVDLAVRPGEILAIVGENGAGKSTLIKILGGAIQPDAGTIRLSDNPVHFHVPNQARRAGIAVIHQELSLVPGLSASANVFLGQEAGRGGFLPQATERRRAADLFKGLGTEIDPDVPCRSLSVAHQQTVEIARALASSARILVMDEPTATLTAHEIERLFASVREMKARGLAIIYVSHRLEEILALADRVLVLRDGACVANLPIGEVTREKLITLMVGRALTEEFPRRQVRVGPPGLVVRDLWRGQAVRGVSFHVGRGEVVGLTGLVGAGRTETARLLFGADRADRGEIELDGRRLLVREPRDAIRAGIGLLPEDRKTQGLVLGHAARENFGLPNLARLSRWGFVRGAEERGSFRGFIERLRIKLAHQDQPVAHLSGGNQQKVVLAKWLARDCAVLLFDEPTRGIDVGARYEMYVLFNELARQGKAILLVSSDLPEVLGMSDRILVMRNGVIAGEIARAAEATQEQVLALAMRAA